MQGMAVACDCLTHKITQQTDSCEDNTEVNPAETDLLYGSLAQNAAASVYLGQTDRQTAG